MQTITTIFFILFLLHFIRKKGKLLLMIFICLKPIYIQKEVKINLTWKCSLQGS